MAKVSMSTALNAPADAVWQVIGGFDALPDWHPAVEGCDLEHDGRQRRLSVSGGVTVIERLEAVEDQHRAYTYTLQDSPFPIANYRSTIRVVGEGDGCRVEWTSEFAADGTTEDDATAIVREVYQAGLDNLRKMFGGR